jgi:hypothetical protein
LDRTEHLSLRQPQRPSTCRGPFFTARDCPENLSGSGLKNWWKFLSAARRRESPANTCLGDTATLEAMALPWPPRASTLELPDVVDRLVDADKCRDYL